MMSNMVLNWLNSVTLCPRVCSMASMRSSTASLPLASTKSSPAHQTTRRDQTLRQLSIESQEHHRDYWKGDLHCTVHMHA